MRIHIAQKIPAWTCPLGHSVGFAPGGFAAGGASGVDPVVQFGQGRVSALSGNKIVGMGQQQRKLHLVDGDPAAVFAVHQRNGLAPVALTRKHPVAQFIVYAAAAKAFLHKPVDGFFDGFIHRKPVDKAGIDHDACAVVDVCTLGDIAAGNHLNNRQSESRGKFPVALVMTRYAHDGACAIGHKHVVGNINRNDFFIDGVDGRQTLQANAGFFFDDFGSLKIRFFFCLCAVGQHFFDIADHIAVFIDKGVLRRDDHVGGAKNRIRTRGVDAEFVVVTVQRKVNIGAFAAADPVGLLQANPFNIIYRIQVVQKALGIIGDFQHPLIFGAANDFAAAALADAADHFFIGQTHFAAYTKVDGEFFFVGEAFFEQLQKYPLCPFIIVGIRRADFTGPVKGIAQWLQLTFKPRDVVFCDDGGVNARFHRIVLRGQAKGVPAHGEQHVVALHALHARDHVQRRIGARVPHMEAFAGGVGKFYQIVSFCFGTCINCTKAFLFFPNFLPLFFDGAKIIVQSRFSFVYQYMDKKIPYIIKYIRDDNCRGTTLVGSKKPTHMLFCRKVSGEFDVFSWRLSAHPSLCGEKRNLLLPKRKITTIIICNLPNKVKRGGIQFDRILA